MSRSAPGAGAEDGAGRAGASAAPSAAPPDVAGSGALAPGRRVERSTRLELGTTAGRFAAVTDGVVRATQRAGGFVASSQLQQGGGAGDATFVLRVPAGRLGAAVADLSRLAHVRSIEQATEDLTGAVDRTTSGLRDARIEHRALVAALATATGPDAIRLRERLARADARAARLDRARRALLRRVRYATVDLSVHRERPPRGGGRPRRPLDAGRRLARRAAGAGGRGRRGDRRRRRRAPVGAAGRRGRRGRPRAAPPPPRGGARRLAGGLRRGGRPGLLARGRLLAGLGGVRVGQRGRPASGRGRCRR